MASACRTSNFPAIRPTNSARCLREKVLSRTVHYVVTHSRPIPSERLPLRAKTTKYLVRNYRKPAEKAEPSRSDGLQAPAQHRGGDWKTNHRAGDGDEIRRFEDDGW